MPATLEMPKLPTNFRPSNRFVQFTGTLMIMFYRRMFPADQRFSCEEVDVLMTHIGGYPGRYEPRIRNIFKIKTTTTVYMRAFAYSESDSRSEIPFAAHQSGCCRNKGFHQVCTAVRFVIDGKNIRDLEVLEFERTAFQEI